MRVLTIATLPTLPRARVLASSLHEHEPDWPLEVVLVADARVVSELQEPDGLRVRSATEELELDVETLLARYEHEDLSALLLPRLLRARAQRTREPVVHLPSSAWVLGPLSPLEEAITRHDTALVPRVAADVPEDGREPSPLQLERAGRIDETIVAVDGSPACESFLGWWGAHVEGTLGSLDARERGARPEDRVWLGRFLELAPARFATAVLEDPGFNLSMWNLHDRELEAGSHGLLVDEGWPVRLLNLPGFDPGRPHRLNAMASRVRVSRSAVLHELCERYAGLLRAAGWRDSEHRDYVGRRLPGGVVYDESLRAMHTAALALGEGFEDPFTEQGAGAFLAWLEGPAPRGAGQGVNRYLYYRVARERPDVIRAYPDIDGHDAGEFLAWCRAFGARELGIPERFMVLGAPASVRARGQKEPASAPAPPATPPRAQAPGALEDRAVREPYGEAPAVRLTGFLGHTLGLGAAARAYARALDAAGVAVQTASVPLHHLELPVALEAGYGTHSFEELAHDRRHAFELVAVNADELPQFVERLGEDYFRGPRIGIWGWETNAIPERWQPAFSLVQEIWVYSSFMAENIGAAAPVPVIALPPPVQAPAQAPAPLRLGVPDGFLFLYMFDYLSTIQRKNPVGLIEAFKRAFAPGEGPQLLIKTINAPLRPLAEEEVLWAAHGRADVHLLDRSLDATELWGVLAACDCYVSLHRAEGFGLTLAEAMALGKPVIGTGYSGNVDFMSEDNSYLVDYALGRVGPDCEIYPPEGEWAEPSIEHAAELMRRVYERETEASEKGARARSDIAGRLSPEVTGARMRERLEALARRSPRRGLRGLLRT